MMRHVLAHLGPSPPEANIIVIGALAASFNNVVNGVIGQLHAQDFHHKDVPGSQSWLFVPLPREERGMLALNITPGHHSSYR